MSDSDSWQIRTDTTIDFLGSIGDPVTLVSWLRSGLLLRNELRVGGQTQLASRLDAALAQATTRLERLVQQLESDPGNT